MVTRITSLSTLGLVVLACNVSNTSSSTGGIDFDNGVCPQALVVTDTDYTSTNVSLVGIDGTALSESVISSGSTPAGLTTALSGDVVLPLTRPASGRLVLIDRYPNSVVTWLDPETAKVLGQLSVGTGFESNPHDYLEVSASKAYVSRYGTNPTPGVQPFDDGDDLLIVDTDRFSITGRIALASPDDGEYFPRADRMIGVGTEVWVVLQRMNADVSASADSRLVGVNPSTDAVDWSLDLPNAAQCSGFSRSPSGTRVALACTGDYSDADATSRSTIILLDATLSPPTEVRRFEVAQELHTQLGPAVAFAREDLLLGTAYGDGVSTNDLAFSVDVDAGTSTVLLDSGAAYALGGVFCDPGCADTCWLADSQALGLHRWTVDATTLTETPLVNPDPSVGLAPHELSAL